MGFRVLGLRRVEAYIKSSQNDLPPFSTLSIIFVCEVRTFSKGS